MSHMSKKIFWSNVHEQANQEHYIELEQISKNRWKCTLDMNEFIIRTTSTDYYEVMELALLSRPRRTP